MILCSAVLTSAQSVPLTSSAETPPCRPASQSRSGSDSSEPPSGGTHAPPEPAQSDGQQMPSTDVARPCDSHGEQTKRISLGNSQLPGGKRRHASPSADSQTEVFGSPRRIALITRRPFSPGYWRAIAKPRMRAEFDDGAAASARYYWHSFADEAVGNYFTEAIVPSLTREDPRYYTLGRLHGGFFRRAGYALTRLVITRSDSGGTMFNFSEIVAMGWEPGLRICIIPARNAPWAKQERSGPRKSA